MGTGHSSSHRPKAPSSPYLWFWVPRKAPKVLREGFKELKRPATWSLPPHRSATPKRI